MIDQLDAQPRTVETPFRTSVVDVSKRTGCVSVAGRLEAGNIQVGETSTVIPGSEMTVVK
ncbi:hypothetical protein BGZ65_004245, partial [Modicella reniformis]